MDDIAGRVAFITGGAQGIGLGIARALVAAGTSVALADIDEPALASAERELEQRARVATFVLDVRDRDKYPRVADKAEERLGPVSLLFNNAGVAGRMPPEQMTYEMWDWVLGINLGGVVNGIQTFVPRIIERARGGHVVNTASGAGLATFRQGGAGLLYVTSKYAVVGLSEALALDLEPFDIGVSVLCPGPVATNIQDTTPRTRPASGHRPPEGRVAERKAVLAQGASPDAVGEHVLAAIRADRVFIHTDRIMEKPIVSRTKRLLDAMEYTIPSAP